MQYCTYVICVGWAWVKHAVNVVIHPACSIVQRYVVQLDPRQSTQHIVLHACCVKIAQMGIKKTIKSAKSLKKVVSIPSLPLPDLMYVCTKPQPYCVLDILMLYICLCMFENWVSAKYCWHYWIKKTNYTFHLLYILLKKQLHCTRKVVKKT